MSTPVTIDNIYGAEISKNVLPEQKKTAHILRCQPTR